MVIEPANPSDAATREVVLARALDVASRFAAAGQQLDVLQQQVGEQLRSSVAQVNRLSANIAELNQRISVAQGLGQPPNDLLDQRDQALSDLSQQLQLSTVRADDGSVTVFVASGQRLVMRAQAQRLSVQPDPSDATRAVIGLSDGGSLRLLQTQELGGGSVAGLLRFQDEDLVDARTLMGQLAAALAGKVNAQQALGLDMGTPPGIGAPIFSAGAPVAVPNANNATSGQVSLSIIDASQLRASEYALSADPGGAPGVWQLTRLQDGFVSSIHSGQVVDGMRIDIGSPPAPAPAAGDRFLLQPVTRAANDMQRVLDDVNGIAAASSSSANGNALAFTALREAAMVGGSTITDAYASAMADIGVRVQGASSSAQISSAVAAQAESARSANSGVNLDEEAARLIQYQQSYQAAAKILQIAQTIFDTLLDAAR